MIGGTCEQEKKEGLDEEEQSSQNRQKEQGKNAVLKKYN